MICSPEHFLNHVCYEIGIKELIRDGYLSPLVSKAGINRADFSGVHVRAGEFVSGEVERLVGDDALVSAACAEMVELTQDRRAVLIFASSVGTRPASRRNARQGSRDQLRFRHRRNACRRTRRIAGPVSRRRANIAT